MTEFAVIKDRTLIYIKCDANDDWVQQLPDKNWLLLCAADEKGIDFLSYIIDHTLNKNVAYVCCVGENSELLHDLFDEEFVMREIGDGNENPMFDNVLMTTWHRDFEESIRFAVFTAEDDAKKIETIICLDASAATVKSNFDDFVRRCGQ